MNVGVNLWGLHKEIEKDFDGVLQGLKQAGFSFVEGCIFFPNGREGEQSEAKQHVNSSIWWYEDAAEKIEKVRSAGLDFWGAHVMTAAETEEEFERVIPYIREFGKKHQMKCFVISIARETDGMKPFLVSLQRLAEELKKDGIQFVYHNHEMECVEKDGCCALDLIVEHCPDVNLQMDVGWVKFSGQNVIAFMKRFQERIALLHLKDVTEDACQENRARCFTAIGEGSIPLKEILSEKKNCPIAMDEVIIDQDAARGDFLEELARGYQNICKNASE